MGIIFRVTWANGSHGNGLAPTIPPKEGEVHADYADGADDFIKQSCVCGFCICQPMTIYHTELHRTTQTKELKPVRAGQITGRWWSAGWGWS